MKNKIIAKYIKMVEERREDTMYNYDDLFQQSINFLESAISLVEKEAYKQGIKDERARSEREFINPLKKKITATLNNLKP